jgi:hypothetical protein
MGRGPNDLLLCLHAWIARSKYITAIAFWPPLLSDWRWSNELNSSESELEKSLNEGMDLLISLATGFHCKCLNFQALVVSQADDAYHTDAYNLFFSRGEAKDLIIVYKGLVEVLNKTTQTSKLAWALDPALFLEDSSRLASPVSTWHVSLATTDEAAAQGRLYNSPHVEARVRTGFMHLQLPCFWNIAQKFARHQLEFSLLFICISLKLVRRYALGSFNAPAYWCWACFREVISENCILGDKRGAGAWGVSADFVGESQSRLHMPIQHVRFEKVEKSDILFIRIKNASYFPHFCWKVQV